jgi:hypothetical protein
MIVIFAYNLKKSNYESELEWRNAGINNKIY